MAWPLVGRDEELEFVCSTLLEDRNGGVLVVGEPASARPDRPPMPSAALADRFEHIYVRGSTATSATPYGALSVVLAQLDAATATNPLLLLSALQDSSRLRRGGKRTLMLVDNVEALDAGSAMVIAHPCAGRSSPAAGDLRRHAAAPGRALRLWKDDVLRRLDVDPSTSEKPRPCSRPPRRKQSHAPRHSNCGWQAGGIPGMSALAETDSRSGHLFIRDGCG
jgi:hypothetical protein